jgi:tRNA splicing endonuclease
MTPGDPAVFHACFVVHVLAAPLPLRALCGGVRLAHTVHKRVLLASVKSDGNVAYITVQWAPTPGAVGATTPHPSAADLHNDED